MTFMRLFWAPVAPANHHLPIYVKSFLPQPLFPSKSCAFRSRCEGVVTLALWPTIRETPSNAHYSSTDVSHAHLPLYSTDDA